MKIRSISILLILICIISMSIVVNGQDISKPDKIDISSGAAGGTFYPVAVATADILTKNGITSSAKPGGGVQNIISVGNGQTEIGVTYMTTLPAALKGEDPFNEKYNVSVLAKIWLNVSQTIVLKESGVKSFKDLKGKTFAGSLMGQGSQVMFNEVLSVYGLSEDDLKMRRGSQSEGAQLLKDKHVIGWSAVTGLANSTIQEMAMARDIRVLGMSEEEFEELQKINPGYMKFEIPAGTIPGQESEVLTPASYGIFVVSNDMPEEHAYIITKILVENLDQYRQTHSVLKDLTVERMALTGDMPLHPGAKRFYEEFLGKKL